MLHDTEVTSDTSTTNVPTTDDFTPTQGDTYYFLWPDFTDSAESDATVVRSISTSTSSAIASPNVDSNALPIGQFTFNHRLPMYPNKSF